MNDINLDINLRIKTVRQSVGLSQTDFGKRLGLGRSYISAIELGQRTIKDRLIFQICQEFGISESWLRTGIGDMEAPHAHPSKINKLIDLFNALDNDKQNIVITLLKNMNQ